MSVKVKICGITNIKDAFYSCDCGCDALGFVFYKKSPRFISLEDAASITKALPPFVLKAGIFVNPGRNEVKSAFKDAKINIAQLHGDESRDFCINLNLPFIKAFRVKDDFNLKVLSLYSLNTYLLDAYSESSYGGTGELINLNVAKKASKLYNIILSGGLTSDNVIYAIKAVKPYAVDVSSGVEKSPGIKDRAKVRKFIDAVKG